MGQAAGEGFVHTGGVFLGKVAEHGVTGGAFDQHAHGRAVALAQNQIALVVTGDQTGLHFGGTLVDQHPVLNLALGRSHAPTARFSHPVASSQALDQLTLKFTDRDNVNIAVNRFVAGVHVRKLRVVELEHARNLFRRPASPEPGVHFVPQRRVLGDVAAAPLAGASSRARGLVRTVRAVAAPSAVALEFQANRARRAFQIVWPRPLACLLRAAPLAVRCVPPNQEV